jgi:hypothetical protein
MHIGDDTVPWVALPRATLVKLLPRPDCFGWLGSLDRQRAAREITGATGLLQVPEGSRRLWVQRQREVPFGSVVQFGLTAS